MSGNYRFMGNDFLLNSEYAKKLYHGYAKQMPVFDYHCHLPAQEIWENKKFNNITEAWLGGDHYKWRLMRIAGVPEAYITGNAGPYDKFLHFVKALNIAPKNPVYHWAHKELSAYFGLKGPLTTKNAKDVFEKTSAMLNSDGFSVRSIIKKSNVTAMFTTDDPIDDLAYHKKLKADASFGAIVAPAFRPDKAFNIENAGFAQYVESAGKLKGIQIKSFSDFVAVLEKCLLGFVEMGARASDHSFSTVPFVMGGEPEANSVFCKAMGGAALSNTEIELYKTSLISALAELYTKNNIVMELHIGALRNQNTNMFNKLGADTGFDAIYDNQVTYKLGRLLDMLNSAGSLPKTIVFPLNPSDFVPVASLLGCFADGSSAGKAQLGAAWWHNDHIEGIRSQLNAFSATGALGTFCGMLTDSRSFFSYERHDYFRRVLSSFLAECVNNGEFIGDLETCGSMVQNISYNNAVNYFNINF